MSLPLKSQLNVVAIGNAIVDIVAFADNSFLDSHKLSKSAMQLCSRKEQDALLSEVIVQSYASGGSAANTMTTLAGLGLRSGFIGTVADDEWGKTFNSSLEDARVVSYVEKIVSKDISSGTCVVLVTPDSERTMNTHLGAAAHITKDALDLEVIRATPYLYIEGYAYDRDNEKATVLHAMNISRSAKNSVALSLSDAACVERHHQDFCQLVKKVDILFANEAEICALFGVNEQVVTEQLLRANKEVCAPLTVVTQSERGCLIMNNSTFVSLPARAPDTLVDLTGAGDQFAAGFLFGLINNYSLEHAGKCGIVLATEVISRLGPRITRPKLEAFSQLFAEEAV
ncbi:MAG TPA: adenosine kinase [Acidimicrobiia bacterium]|nr:adenosine kinase [Acidimicrobiia bacterium]